MIRKDLRVSGTYLLCNGNRIHKFRIKWRSKSAPTMEQRREVMRVTEDIVKTNNLPERITTGQLKITTKISFWSPRSKALSLRQFRSEKQGHLSAHKHSYVLRVSLADSKEQQDCEHVHTFSFMHSEVGWKNELQPFHPEKKVVETVANGINFVQMNGIQLHTKDAGAMMHDGKHMCQNQANTKESVEVIVDRYDGEQHFARTNETERDFVSRIEKLEKLVERACMAAKVHQSESHVCSSGSQQTCVSSQSQELRAFNSTVSIKQQTVEENNSLQDNLHKSKMCEPAVEHIGETESSNVQNVKVGSIDNRNYQPLDAENAEKLRYMVKGNNGMYKCTATSDNLLKDKDKYEVETNGVVHILSSGDDFSGIVKPRCSSMEEEMHLGRVKRPVQVHYDEICIPSVSYYRSPHFSATNSVKQKDNIGCSSGAVLFERDNTLDTASGSRSHLQINSELKVAQHSLAKPITSKTADVSPKEVLLNAAVKLASLKELQTIPSIRALRTTLIQQGVDKAIEQIKLSSSVYPECYISTCSQDFSLYEIPLKSRSRTVTTASDSCNTLDRFEDCSNTSTAGSLTEIYSSVFEGSAKNDCNIVNRSQNCRPQSFHRKMSSEKIVPLDPVVPSVHSKTYVIAKPVRVNVGKLLSCSKIQVFFTTELYVNADCVPGLTDCKLHNMSPNSQASSNGEGDLIKSFLQLMAFNAAQKACSSFSNQPSVANESLRFKISERNKLHATSLSECVVNSNKMTLSHAYNFLKCTCLSTETTESISSTFSHCKCPPSVKFQGVSASYTVMSSQAKRITPRRQLIDIIHNIKSDVKDRSNICDRQHCFYFHVDEEESVEGFYSTVEKYCSALSKFHSHQYTSSRSIEILLRDIWLPGHKHSISFYVNLPLQKCKCIYCGLDTTVELCLNCGELFERTELGNYVPFFNQKTPEHVNMKMETSEAAVEVLNLVNNLYLCKPVVVVQQTDTNVCKQNKTSGRIRKKRKHLCCTV
ncbi:uncharacterized protein LOC126188841 isoform X2 [Schistocerca cancellata]|uniref:uncharacterized protein LOC126188841 isoform X2 n=1 Tax=Schistocerca cancellata TaxID=274614 RepID=UPI002117A753|nr:uncharacterized protein LOC126188841 isoform X2 [Schistocerca cancellata]